MLAISEILALPLKELEESFSPGPVPFSVADFVRALAATAGQGLIASCFAGRIRPSLFDEDEEALREAFGKSVVLAIFFPFPLTPAPTVKHPYSDALSSHHRDAWRSVVKFWKLLRSLSPDPNSSAVKLFHPWGVTGGANVVFPPMFYRPALLCERVNGRTKVDLYSWTQGDKYDAFYGISGRSVEPGELQAEAWELFFGDVYQRWDETGELPDGDSYWRMYGGPSETDADQ